MLKVSVIPEEVPVLSNAVQAGRQAVAHVKQAEQQQLLVVQAQRLLMDVKRVEHRFHNTGLAFSF